jgi:dihydropyrimidinase
LTAGHRAQGTGHRERPGLLIRGGTVWGENGGRRADVRIEGERIVEVGTLRPVAGEEVLDAGALDVLPGMIDAHVHIDDRIGRYELADTFPTASEIAARTGITALAGFATQRPGEALRAAVERCVARARGRSTCDFTFHITPTVWPWDWDEVAGLIGRGFSTFKLYTTYREAGLYTDYARLREVMTRLAPLGGRLLVHCEDDGILAAEAGRALDPADARGHGWLRPEAAEVSAIRKVMELAAATGCRAHVVHVSTAEGAAAVADARARCAVSCETAPHYLALEESALAGENGHRFLCTPPLRCAATRRRMEAAASSAAFDLFATDHCAFSTTDKDADRGEFRLVPKGLAGLGALVPLVFELLVRHHALPLSELVRRLAANPARLLGVYPRKGTIAPGSDADLVVLDRNGPARAVVSSLADCHETYPGRTTTLAFRHVLAHGREIVRDGGLVAAERTGGRCLASA